MSRVTPCGLALVLVAGQAWALPPQGGALARLDQIGPALRACWQPPAGAAGRAVTVRFSLTRDGSLLGPPRFLAPVLGGDDRLDGAFLAAVQEAFARCTPLRLTAGLGGAIAGRVFSMRFATSRRPAGGLGI